MKAIAFAIASITMAALSASGQIPKHGFDNKGYPDKSFVRGRRLRL